MRHPRSTTRQGRPEAPPLRGCVTVGSGETGGVALATCAEFAGREPDDLRVIAALARRGIAATHAVWDDPDVSWPSFRLVVVRSTWDYPDRRDAFLTWANGCRRTCNTEG